MSVHPNVNLMVKSQGLTKVISLHPETIVQNFMAIHLILEEMLKSGQKKSMDRLQCSTRCARLAKSAQGPEFTDDGWLFFGRCTDAVQTNKLMTQRLWG